jgi:hypothetical protein
LRYKSNSSCASLPPSRILRRFTPWQILFELGQDKRISLNIVRISLLNKYDGTGLYMRQEFAENECRAKAYISMWLRQSTHNQPKLISQLEFRDKIREQEKCKIYPMAGDRLNNLSNKKSPPKFNVYTYVFSTCYECISTSFATSGP